MQPGRRRDRVTLKSVATAQNTAGEPVPAETTVATVWAMVQGDRGDESFAAARVEADRAIKVCILWRTDVTTAWRLTWRGETYDIADVDRSRRADGELWLMARARKVS